MTIPPLPARCAPTASLKSREETSMTPTPNLERSLAHAKSLRAELPPGSWFRLEQIIATLSDLRTMAEERDAAVEALEGAHSKMRVAEDCMRASGHWENKVGYVTDAGLWLDRAMSQIRAALSGLRLSEGGGRISSSSDALRGDGSLPVLAPAQNSDGGQG